MAHKITAISSFGFKSLDKEIKLPGDKDQVKKLEEILKAFNDDFWQKGAGSLLPPARGTEASVVTNLLHKRFVFRNVIRECVERVSGAFYGKSPNWGFNDGSTEDIPIKDPAEEGEPVAPVSTEETPDKDRRSLEKALGEWWTRENVATKKSQAFESRLVVGKGGLRIYVPAKYATAVTPTKEETAAAAETKSGKASPKLDQVTVDFKTIEEALDAIKIEFIEPDRATLLDDDSELFSIVRYSRRQNWENSDDIKVIEFSFVDNEGLTFVGVVEENADPGTIQQANLSDPLPLGGATTYNEFQGPPYVTPGLYKNNQLLNLALTCSGFSLVDNGFQETFFTNVDVEMEEIDDPSAEGGKRLVPKNIKRGGGAIQNLIGVTQEDENGVETRATPSVTFREPSTMTAFKDGKELAYTGCLEEAGQLYAKISGDAVASGESRIQAMTDFWLRIRKYKPEVDEQGQWVLTTVVKLAAALCGKQDQYKDISMSYDSKVFIGQVSSSERELILSMRDKGLISRETASVLLGVEDPALENELITSEAREAPFVTTPFDFSAKLDIALKMQGIFPQDYIFKYLGITDEDTIKQLKKALADETGLFVGDPNLEIDPATGQPLNPEDPTAVPPVA